MSTILLILITIIVTVLLLAMRQPDDFSLTRSTVINAPANVVFDLVNSPRKFQEWSPWAKMEPDAKVAFSGPETGVGASNTWEGKKTGAGIMTVQESIPSQLVRFRLEFLKPMKAVNTVDFVFAPQGDKTHVSWTMYGPNNFVGKIMGTVMNCQKMMNEQFDEGLRSLKALAEK